MFFRQADEPLHCDINIGISVRKGNTELKDKINSALAGMTEDDFNRIMDEAAKIQPLSK